MHHRAHTMMYWWEKRASRMGSCAQYAKPPHHPERVARRTGSTPSVPPPAPSHYRLVKVPSASDYCEAASTTLTDVHRARQQARGRIPDAPALLELAADCAVGCGEERIELVQSTDRCASTKVGGANLRLRYLSVLSAGDSTRRLALNSQTQSSVLFIYTSAVRSIDGRF